MQKTITLSIPTPCHENWNNMQPSEQGRFCLSCQKQVVDFSAMTDEELFNFFAKRTDQNICGRAMPDQLNAAISKPVEHKKKRFWYIHYLSTLFLFINKSEAQAQVKPPVTTTPVPVDKTVWLGKMLAVPAITSPRTITGKITGPNGEAVAFASILVKGTKNGVAADARGNFSITVTQNDKLLQVSAIAYESLEISIFKLDSISISLRRSAMELQGAVVIVNRNEDDIVGYDQPKHIAKIIVKDQLNGKLIKAKIDIREEYGNRKQTVYTDSKGSYQLRRIKEDQRFRLTFSAAGYKEKQIIIAGGDFDKKAMTKLVQLEQALPERMIKMGEMNIQNVRLAPSDTILTTAGVTKKGSILPKTKKETFLQKITAVFNKPTLTVYPNPVYSGTNTTVRLTNFAKGNYLLNVVTASGQTVSSRSIDVLSNNETASIGSDVIKFPGVYVISFMNSSTKKITSAKLLVQ